MLNSKVQNGPFCIYNLGVK